MMQGKHATALNPADLPLRPAHRSRIGHDGVPPLRRDIHGLDISSIINHSSLPIGCMNILSRRSLTLAQPLRRLRLFTESLASTMAGMLALNLIMCYTDRTIQHPDQSSCPAHLAQESRPYSIASLRPIPTNTASQSHVQPTLLLTYCPNH